MVRHRCAVQNAKQHYRLYGRPTGTGIVTNECCELVAKAVNATGAVLLSVVRGSWTSLLLERLIQ